MRESITKETSKGMLYLCNKCKQYLPKNKFNIDNTNLHGRRGNLCRECKDCQRKRYYAERQRLLNDDYAALRYKLQAALKSARMKNDLSMEELTSLCSMILNTVNESKNSNHENN